VKAANSDGVWNEEGASLQFIVRAPWWQRWWAYLIAGVSLLLVSYWFYRFQLSKRLVIEEGNRLREMDQLKNSFYTNITHEFRTPLTIINGMVDELAKDPLKDAKKKLGLIKKNSHSLLRMVDQMLKLSRLQAGKESLELKQGNILLFVQYLVEANESLARLKHISLNYYSEEKELVMDFDAQKLKTVLTNLISNSIKFTEVYGKVLVVGKKIRRGSNDYLEIQVRDNGIGIPSDQLSFVFDRFHQVKTDGENQGIGVGLALVKELVDTMRGEIHVESELGKSTVFTLRLPVHRNAAMVDSNMIAKTEQVTGLDHVYDERDEVPFGEDSELPKLLIIEDNLDVIYYLQVCLEEQYQIQTCRNGLDGVERAYEMIPDIIISDVMMPKMDGFEVCAKLKNDDRTNHIPIILLTAKATSEDKLKGLSHGADAYLIKPFEKEELMIRLEKLMLLRKTLQQKYSEGLLTDVKDESGVEDQVAHFIRKVEKEVLANLDDDTFSVNELAQVLFLSRSQVHRKIKALTGMSTSIYIRRIRLLKAKELIRSTDLSISEVVYAVGFKSPAYFSQVFKESFGENPSAMRSKAKPN